MLASCVLFILITFHLYICLKSSASLIWTQSRPLPFCFATFGRSEPASASLKHAFLIEFLFLCWLKMEAKICPLLFGRLKMSLCGCFWVLCQILLVSSSNDQTSSGIWQQIYFLVSLLTVEGSNSAALPFTLRQA